MCSVSAQVAGLYLPVRVAQLVVTTDGAVSPCGLLHIRPSTWNLAGAPDSYLPVDGVVKAGPGDFSECQHP